MAAPRRLKKNARIAVAAATIALLAGPLLLLKSCVSTDQSIVASSGDDDRLVFVGRHTMLLEPGSPGRKIADWLKLETTDTRAFEIGDQAFLPKSVELTARGHSQIVHFAQIMKAHPELKTQILVSAGTPSDDRKLEEMRAGRLREEIVASGAPASSITAGDESGSGGRMGEKPGLLVLLSR